MKPFYLSFCLILTTVSLLADTADQVSPVTPQDLEDAYTVAIERRTDDIMSRLALTDSAKSEKVRKTILAQYRSLRARDEAIDAKLKAAGKDPSEVEKQRAALYQGLSKPIHDDFLKSLSAELTPEQMDLVKDRMTYGKVKFTYDAYCQIIPGITEAEKKKVLELLKQARDEAMDGGSVGQKSQIFQKYKDQINAYLDAQGHDTAKALKEWDAKQAAAKKEQGQ